MAGNAAAIADLAKYYEHTWGVFPQSRRLARHWLRQLERSARNGNPFAARLLGEHYMGRLPGGITYPLIRNHRRGKHWLNLAIRLGDCVAHARLENYTPRRGPGEKDYERASDTQDDTIRRELLELSAAAGHYGAMADLADLYSSGKDGTPVDLDKARQWRERLLAAAARGDATAQWEAGDAFARRQGFPVDAAQARHWLAKAADNGHAEAAYSFWEHYVAEAGDTPLVADRAEAVCWFRRAAKLGHAEAVYLSAQHRGGHPTPEGLAMIEYAARSDVPSAAGETLDWLRRRRHVDRKPPRRPARAAR